MVSGYENAPPLAVDVIVTETRRGVARMCERIIRKRKSLDSTIVCNYSAVKHFSCKRNQSDQSFMQIEIVTSKMLVTSN